jgi:hypothetical protein
MSQVAVIVMLVLAGACSAATGGGSRRNADVITAEEVAEFVGFSAREVIQRLRPTWLRGRGSADPPVVFVDGIRMGGLEVLNTLQTTQFREIRHRSGPDATTLYGTGVGGGTIEVRTRSP